MKAQEAAPFEVLISVIVMGFVLTIGFFAMNQLSQEKLEKELKLSVYQIKNVFEEAAQSSVGTFSLQAYYPFYKYKNPTLMFIKVTKQRVCNTFCPGTLGVCWIIFYGEPGTYNKMPLYCLKIHPSTVFDCPDNYDTDKYQEVNPTTSLPPGRYVIKVIPDQDNPTICVLRVIK